MRWAREEHMRPARGAYAQSMREFTGDAKRERDREVQKRSGAAHIESKRGRQRRYVQSKERCGVSSLLTLAESKLVSDRFLFSFSKV